VTIERPEDRFGDRDETLADGPVEPAPDAARPWLTEQRCVHGLLRALHTADAAAREARVQAVLAKIAAPRYRVLARLPGLAAAAALVALGVYLAWPDPDRLPRAEAMVSRALHALEEPIDRDFTLHVDVERGERHIEREWAITIRPGRRFLVEGESPFGRFRAGCDGELVWFQPMPGIRGMDVPLAEARRLTERFGEVLDLGYLDLDALLRRLPQDTELRCVGREGPGIRVEAIGTVNLPHLALRSISMLVDDRSGMLSEVRAVATGAGRSGEVEARLFYRHVGDRELGEGAYERPW